MSDFVTIKDFGRDTNHSNLESLETTLKERYIDDSVSLCFKNNKLTAILYVDVSMEDNTLLVRNSYGRNDKINLAKLFD